MSETIFALVDCNNFYCSCERAFQPHLQHKPVVVLSNNDGCAVARSNEVKALGVKMGTPYFKIQPLVAKHNIQVFSSNYTLYGDMSNRVMQILREFTNHLEVYSIDEAFLDLSGLPGDLLQYARQIRQTLMQGLGLPVCVGVGPTKTLAKVANHIAKQYGEFQSCFDIRDEVLRSTILKQLPVKEVWGVGRQSAERLNRLGIENAYQLSQMDLSFLRAQFSVVMMRIAMELNGTPCLFIEEVAPPRQQIISSRSFGKEITTLDALKQAVATYTAKAAIKLRQQKSMASAIMVYIHTNPHKPTPQYHKSTVMTLPNASLDTRALVHYALQGLEHIFKAGFAYKKAGIALMDIQSDRFVQTDLFEDQKDNQKTKTLMSTVDAVQERFGRQSIFYAQEGVPDRADFKLEWRMRQDKKSRAYTTNWQDLPIVKA